MKITISVGGRFHAFDLAQQLLKRDYLERLITSYPKFEVKKYGIPKDKTCSIFIKEILYRGWSHLPEFIKIKYDPTYLINEIFDKLASRHIGKPDIFVGFSSKSLHSLRAAKKGGAITVLEHGSAHIVYFDNIIKEEYRKWGIETAAYRIHPKVIEKELKEFSETDYISVPSSFAKRTFIEKGIPESKLIQIPYGVDLSSFRQVPKEDNVFRVVYAGGMSLLKGVHYLLQAFAELNLPDSELLLMGALNDEMRPFFKKYDGKFKWVGHVPQNEMYKYYSQGSVFVMNSLQDGFGMVIIQAMACGLPVVASENTGGPDVVRNGKDGYIIPIRDVKELKRKLEYLYQNQDVCREMGRSAKERASSGFTWDDYGEKMVNAYKIILGKNK